MTREEYMLKPFRENADIIGERVNSGIENARKGFGTIKLVNAAGEPVKGTIKLTQKTHDFKHGANIFMLDEFESEEKNAEYRRIFKEYFNLATVPFYWRDLEPDEGKPRYAKDSPKVYRRPAPDLCVEYCEQNGIAPKAHCLNYAQTSPRWLDKYPAEKQWELLEQRFRQCAERYSNRIHGWEVTNESFWGNRTKIYFDSLFMERSFKMAERLFPQNELICNEGGEPFRDNFLYNRNQYFMQVERAKLKGARIDTVGFQYHIWSGLDNEQKVIEKQFDPVNMFRVFDTFANAFNCPFQMTEVTLPCHAHDSSEAEDIQAEVLRQLYTIWFSIPNMEAIIYWNLVDGYAYDANPGDFLNGQNRLAGGLTHFDMTPKPALNMLKKLFNEEWHTECLLLTNDGGTARFKGFYGSYNVEITTEGKSETKPIHLEKNVDKNPMFTFTI